MGESSGNFSRFDAAQMMRLFKICNIFCFRSVEFDVGAILIIDGTNLDWY